MKIEITMEKTQRFTMEFDVTEDQLELLRSGENPFWDEMKKGIEKGEGVTEYDYAVNDLEGNEIVSWS